LGDHPAEAALDGRNDTFWHSQCNETNQWWMIDLQREIRIHSVKIHQSIDIAVQNLWRIEGAEIRVGNVNAFDQNPACAANLTAELVIDTPCVATGRYVFVVQLIAANNKCLHFNEIEIFAHPCQQVQVNAAQACQAADGQLLELSWPSQQMSYNRVALWIAPSFENAVALSNFTGVEPFTPTCRLSTGTGAFPNKVFTAQKYCTERAGFSWMGENSAATANACAKMVRESSTCAKYNFMWSLANRNCGCWLNGTADDCVWLTVAAGASSPQPDGFVSGTDLHFMLEYWGLEPGMEVRVEKPGHNVSWEKAAAWATTHGGRLLTFQEAFDYLKFDANADVIASEWLAVSNKEITGGSHIGKDYIYSGTAGAFARGDHHPGFPSWDQTGRIYVMYLAPTYSLAPSPQDSCVRPSFCTFPFMYEGRGHGQCTMQGHSGRSWCGLVLDVDECLSTINEGAPVVDFIYRPNEKFGCNRAFEWLYTYPKSANECARAVLEHASCKKDVFLWKMGDDFNCGCWIGSADSSCSWTSKDATQSTYNYYELLPQVLAEAGRGICWSDCGVHARSSAVEPSQHGACSSCINVLDLHIVDTTLVNHTQNQRVSQWGSAQQSSASSQPIFWPNSSYMYGGPQQTGFVFFDAAGLHSLDAGHRSLQMESGGGLTIVIVVRFTGTSASAITNETLISLGGSIAEGNGSGNGGGGSAVSLAETAVSISRDGTSSRLRFAIAGSAGDSPCVLTSDDNIIVNHEWMTLTARYSAVTNSLDLLKNGRSAAWITNYGASRACEWVARPADRHVEQTLVGRSLTTAGNHFTGGILGIQVLSQYVEDSVASAIGEALLFGYSGAGCCAMSPPLAPTSCNLCETGKYNQEGGATSQLSCQAVNTSTL